MSEELSKTIAWNSRLEEYFSSTGEKAHCLAWIHKQSEALYSKRRTFIDLPVIICSGVLGFLSVGSASMFAGAENISSVAVGVGSLFVSVLNTVGSYFQWSKRAEGHRIASIQYAKLYRFLNIEMSLPREERMSPHDLLKTTKESYDRLQEISPLIPPEIIKEFKERFGNEKYKDISKPEEANGLERIVVFDEGLRPSVKSVQTPSSFFQETPLPPPSRKSSQVPPEGHLREGREGDIYHEPHFQHTSSTSDTRIVPPPPLKVSEPSS
jgi:hypothetical protein